MTLDEFVDAIHESVGTADRSAVKGFVTDVMGEHYYPMDDDGAAEAAAAFSERYDGSHESLADWARFNLSEQGVLAEVPSQVADFIDFGAYGAACGDGNGAMTFVWSGRTVHAFTD